MGRLDQLGFGRSERLRHVLKDFIGWPIGGVRDCLADSPQDRIVGRVQAAEVSLTVSSTVAGISFEAIAKNVEGFVFAVETIASRPSSDHTSARSSRNARENRCRAPTGLPATLPL